VRERRNQTKPLFGGPDPFVQAASGRAVHLLAPRPDDIDIRDIATALAKICRFTGHTVTHYSVAQHSVLVAGNLPESLFIYGLLHDAHEAYLGDLVQPLKVALGALNGKGNGYGELAARFDAAIHARFDLPWPLSEKDRRQLDASDMILLATERRDLLAHQISWGATQLSEPLGERIRPLRWDLAEENFMTQFTRAMRVRALRQAEREPVASSIDLNQTDL
jgi:5'-deoxynucleotidase YfbR-like HD superfamily hydrolase